jgi:hypothetical protein
MPQQLIALLELQDVDHVKQQQGHGRFIRRVAVQSGILCGHKTNSEIVLSDQSELTSPFRNLIAGHFLEHKGTEETERRPLFALSSPWAHSRFAPGMINVDAPTASFNSLTLMMRPGA